jgi:Tfp pilus assembly protein PilZ
MSIYETSLKFKERGQFRDAILPDIKAGGLFVETEETHELGKSILIHVCFPDIPYGIPLLGAIVWRRPPTKWRSAMKPGIGVKIDEASESSWRFLVRFSNGHAMEKRTKGPRISCDFFVDVSAPEASQTARAVNIGPGGLFVRAEKPVPLKTPLEITGFMNADEAPYTYSAEVIWNGAVDGGIGLGMQFYFRSPIQRQRIVHFIEEKLDPRYALPIPEAKSSFIRQSRILSTNPPASVRTTMPYSIIPDPEDPTKGS